MKWSVGRAVLFVVIGSTVLLGMERPRGHSCTPAVRVFASRLPGEQAVVAVASDAWLSLSRSESPFAERGPVLPDTASPEPETEPSDTSRQSLIASTRPSRGTEGSPAEALRRSRPYLAQGFVLESVEAMPMDGLREGDLIWVAPLEHDWGCALWPIDRREWVPPGDSAAFAFDLASVETAPDGRPIVLVRTVEWPFPHAHRRGSRADSRAILTASEFLDFFTALPTVESVQRDPSAALESRLRWANAHSDTLAYPVAEGLSALRHIIAGR